MTIYVPLQIPAKYFAKQDLVFLRELRAYFGGDTVNGRMIWEAYLSVVHAKNEDFVKKKIDLKKIYGIMSQFMFSIFAHSNQVNELLRFCDGESYGKYRILYLVEWEKVYDYKSGIRDEGFKEAAFL
jgi:CRISPR-associated endonuclease/helicase Cas3